MARFIFKILFVCVMTSSICGSPEERNKTCTAVLMEYGNYASQFVNCAIIHAHPITICESCITTYMNAITAHEDILKSDDTSGKACKSVLINVDRLEIIENSFSYVKSLWDNGHCSSCFEFDNGTLTDKLSNDTMKFKNLYYRMNICVLAHYINASYSPSVCNNCLGDYVKINTQYEKIKATLGEGNICMDIIDSINTTRTNWSGILHCGRKEVTLEVPLLAVMIVIGLTPLVFYFTTMKCVTQVETRLSQPNS